ncbi:restriction endonuclease subunit S [Vibrio vulnificus]
MVPNGWQIRTVGHLFEVQLGKMLNKLAKEKHPQYPYLGNSDVRWGYFNLSDLKSMHFNEREMDKFTLKNGDILMCEGGEVGRCAIWNGGNSQVYYQKALHRLRGKGEIAPEYFQSYMSFINGTKLLDDFSTRTSIAHLTREKLLELPVKTPPLAEQRKIAKILATWDKAIATTEKLIETSKQQKKNLMQQLLTGKKRLVKSTSSRSVREGSALSKIGDIPDDWEVDLISKHYWYQEGPGVRKHQFTENGVKLFNGTNIQQSRIDLSNTSTYISSEEAYGPYSHFLAERGDLVIACSGISVERFDEKIAFINETHLPLCMNTSTMRFKVKSETTACLTFMRYFMMSDLFKNQIRRQITGSAQLNFGPSHMAKCFIPLPPLEEQKKIASVLSCADKEVDILEAKLSHFKQEKKALMQQLLTGKRRVSLSS